jgi:hypothetical protein
LTVIHTPYIRTPTVAIDEIHYSIMVNRIRCSDCFRRIIIEEDQTKESATDYHRLRGDCVLVEKPPPIKIRKRKRKIDIEFDDLDDL